MEIDAPEPRNMADEGRASLEAQLELAPDIYQYRTEYDPKYADLELDTLRRALLGSEGRTGLLDLYAEVEPRLTEFTAAAQRGQRERDVRDVEELGPRTVAAVRASDPESAALESRLTEEAMSDLAAGASLDPSLAAEVSQGVRAAQADRGFGFGAPDAVTEAFARGERGVALRDKRRAFAQSILGQRRQAAVDPFLSILGRPSTVPNMAGGVVGQGGTFGRSPTVDPFNAYAAQLFGQNYAGAMDTAAANASMANALIGGGIDAVGSFGGGWLAGR